MNFPMTIDLASLRREFKYVFPTTLEDFEDFIGTFYSFDFGINGWRLKIPSASSLPKVIPCECVFTQQDTIITIFSPGEEKGAHFLSFYELGSFNTEKSLFDVTLRSSNVRPGKVRILNGEKEKENTHKPSLREISHDKKDEYT